MTQPTIRVGVWYDDTTNCYKTGKPVELLGKQYWVNVYPQDPDKKAENPKSPDLNIVLKEAAPKRIYP